MKKTLRPSGICRLCKKLSEPDTGRGQHRLGGVGLLVFLLAAIGPLLAWGPAAAQCIDYADYLHWEGHTSTPYHAMDVAVAGNHAYVADANSGLQVIGITDPANPVIVGSVDTPGDALGIEVSGGYAYVADWTSGLQVIDITIPTSPVIVGSANTPGTAYGVTVSGNYAYVADFNAGLQVIDITNPASPVIVGSVNTPGNAWSVDVVGNYAYLADAGSGLQVIDVTNPASPVIVGSTSPAVGAMDVVVAGNYAYVADIDFGLRVIDVTNPASPAIVGSLATGPAVALDVVGTHAYVGDIASGVFVIDVTSPASPAIVGSVFLPGDAFGVAVAGGYVFTAAYDAGLHVIDASNPASAAIIGTADTGYNTGIALVGDYAYVVSNGLKVVDVTIPTSPTVVGSVVTPAGYDIAVAGGYAYLTDVLEGLQVINITNPASPWIVGSVDTTQHFLGVAVQGSYAYVANDTLGLLVVDVASPATPTIVGGVVTPSRAFGLAVAGSYAYVAADSAGLQVVDITNPMAPVIVGGADTPGKALAVAVVGSYAFVADGAAGLQVIDVTNPTSPAIVSGTDTHGSARRVAVLDSYVYIADGAAGLQVIDITNLASPKIVGNLATATVTIDGPTLTGQSWDVAAADGRIYITHTHIGLKIAPSQCDEVHEYYSEPGLFAVGDVADDQGREISLGWTRSVHDAASDPVVITSYGVYRRQDAAASAPPPLAATAPNRAPALGGWDYVGSVPAHGAPSYQFAAETLCDSTIEYGMCWSVFFVSAMTPDPLVYFDSDPDSGYSVDNIAPGVPQTFSVAHNVGSNLLTWDPSDAEDFAYFNIYRSDNPDLIIPDPPVDYTWAVIHSTIDTTWTDASVGAWRYRYQVTAVDHAGNESGPASPGSITGVTGPALPTTMALYQNAPNPFNPVTVIRFDVPAGGAAVSLHVYDVTGRLVRTLVDGRVTPGRKTAIWDGRNARDNPVSSGIYFYRLQAGEKTFTKKMLLLK